MTQEKTPLVFSKANYLVMLAGIAVIALGFIIMAMDKEEYGFGFLGITLGPIVTLVGFAIEFFAIFVGYKKKND